MKLEASHPLAATCNSGVVISGEDASRVAADYYDIIKKIIEYTFGGCIFQCNWFDPIHNTKVDDFSIVEVKHESRYSDINFLCAHQTQ
jgi:hypothetical protein